MAITTSDTFRAAEIADFQVFVGECGDPGRICTSESVRIYYSQRNNPKTHPFHSQDNRLQSLLQAGARSHRGDPHAAQIVQGAGKSRISAVFNVIGRHAHHIETRLCQSVSVVRASHQF